MINYNLLIIVDSLIELVIDRLFKVMIPKKRTD